MLKFATGGITDGSIEIRFPVSANAENTKRLARIRLLQCTIV